jgi:hypothetical protein
VRLLQRQAAPARLKRRELLARAELEVLRVEREASVAREGASKDVNVNSSHRVVE